MKFQLQFYLHVVVVAVSSGRFVVKVCIRIGFRLMGFDCKKVYGGLLSRRKVDAREFKRIQKVVWKRSFLSDYEVLVLGFE